MEINLATIVITAIVTGICSAAGSTFCIVLAMRVHIEYIKEALVRHENAINRAHARIDKLREHTGVVA